MLAVPLLSDVVPNNAVPLLKVTVPVAVPAPPLTVAVKVTACP
jgi:hypothetical protein